MSKSMEEKQPLLSLTPRVRTLRVLREWIADGRLPADERVPSEQALADAIRVSRTTIRAALAQLEQDGLIKLLPEGRRVICRQSRHSDLSLSRTILLLDTSFPEIDPLQEDSRRQVRDCALGTIQALGLHALILHPGLCQEHRLEQLMEQRPQGLLVLGETDRSRPVIEAFLRRRVPVGCYTDAPTSCAPSTVTVDQRAGAATLTNWLLARGHHRILPCWLTDGGQSTHCLQERLEGYRSALAVGGESSLEPVHCALSSSARSEDEFLRQARVVAGHLVEHLSRNPVDAILANSDRAACVIASACRIFDCEPNRDVAIVGFDNLWASCRERQWEPEGPLASMDPLPRQIAHELVGLVMQPADSPMVHIVHPQLIQLRAV